MSSATVAEIGKVIRKVIEEEQGDTNEATLKAVQRIIKLLTEEIIPRLPEPPNEDTARSNLRTIISAPSSTSTRSSAKRAAARSVSTVVGEILESYDAAPETEHKLLQFELMSRLAEFDRFIPADDSVPSDSMVRSIFDSASELTQLAEEVATRSGLKTETVDVSGDEGVAMYDFSFQTYEEFLETEQNVAADLRADDIGTASFAKFFSKLLSAFGISGKLGKDILYAVESVAETPFHDTVKYIKAGLWSRVAGPLKKVLNAMLTKKFRTVLARRVGVKVAAKIAARIASRFLPIVGWATFIVAFIAAVARQVGRGQNAPEPDAA